VVPKHHRAAYACYFLVGVIAFTAVFAEAVNIVVEIALVRRLQRYFAQGVTQELITRMDLIHDGVVRCSSLR